MEWGPVNWVFMIPITAIVGGIAFLIVQTITKARVRELEIKHRMAMIERGLVPPPEADPGGFERAMHVLETARQNDGCCERANRHRRAGITLMGVGFGLMLLISVAGGNPEAGVGVGGFLVVVGLAFAANAWFERRQPSPSVASDRQVVPPAANRSE